MLLLFWGHVARKYERDVSAALALQAHASAQVQLNRLSVQTVELTQAHALRDVAFTRVVRGSLQPIRISAVASTHRVRVSDAQLQVQADAARQMQLARQAEVRTDLTGDASWTLLFSRQAQDHVQADSFTSRSVDSLRAAVAPVQGEEFVGRVVDLIRSNATRIEILVVNRSRRFRSVRLRLTAGSAARIGTRVEQRLRKPRQPPVD